jgi:hypothetical protein
MYKGTHGTSASVEIDFDQYFNLKPKWTRNWLKIDAYAFGDAGILMENRTAINGKRLYSPLRMDAGFGTAMNIYRWGKRTLIKPFTLRFDMPLFLNTTPYADKNYLQMRWLFGIGRSF